LRIKRLRAIGCSWTYGDELPESTRLQKSYPGLIAQHYGLELDNCGYPGASLESMRWVLYWHLKNKQDTEETLYVVGLTNSDRRSWYNAVEKDSTYNFNFNQPERPWNKHVHSPWLKVDDKTINPNWYELDKLYTTYCYDREWAEYNHWETVRSFSALPHVLIFNCLINPFENSDVVNGKSSFREILKPEQLYARNHPNEKGHEIISKHLIDYIDRANIIT